MSNIQNYRELEREFNRKVKDLQRQCKHKKLVEKGDCWVKGYPKMSHKILDCLNCNKTLIMGKEEL